MRWAPQIIARAAVAGPLGGPCVRRAAHLLATVSSPGAGLHLTAAHVPPSSMPPTATIWGLSLKGCAADDGSDMPRVAQELERRREGI
jgi:hypothetical protein